MPSGRGAAMSDYHRKLTRHEATRVLMLEGCPERFAKLIAELLERCGDEYSPAIGSPFIVISGWGSE
jgi:RNA-binding protein YhbY